MLDVSFKWEHKCLGSWLLWLLWLKEGLDFTWPANRSKRERERERVEVSKLNSISCSPSPFPISSFALSQMSPMKMRNFIYFIIIIIAVVVLVVGQFMVRCLTTKTIKLMTRSPPTRTSSCLPFVATVFVLCLRCFCIYYSSLLRAVVFNFQLCLKHFESRKMFWDPQLTAEWIVVGLRLSNCFNLFQFQHFPNKNLTCSW